MIVSILLTCLFDMMLIMSGEINYWSLYRGKRWREAIANQVTVSSSEHAWTRISRGTFHNINHFLCQYILTLQWPVFSISKSGIGTNIGTILVHANVFASSIFHSLQFVCCHSGFWGIWCEQNHMSSTNATTKWLKLFLMLTKIRRKR